MSGTAYDPAKTIDDPVELAIQIGGKLRGTVTVPRDSAADDVVAALADARVAPLAAGKTLKRAIVVKNKLVNLIFG
ncbi:MAG: hypothetical protein LBR85_08070 [Oscillospiraceae bacterium]|jgi:leucyl-tRNA synthetase|nr:hypothetical protein [Oscillospiraceae bacterium]